MFYTNVHLVQNHVLVRGRKNGERHSYRVEYKPKLFVPSHEGDWKSIDGRTLAPVEPGSVRDSRDFIRQYKDVGGFEIYGLEKFEYAYINETWVDGVDYERSQVVTAYIDIEVAVDKGFPKPEDALQPVTAITIAVDDKYYVLHYGEYAVHRDDVVEIKCKDEIDLLLKFGDLWNRLDPDIITGWNCMFFDIPYLVNRITNRLGDKKARQLSPWNMLIKNEREMHGKTQLSYKIVGIEILDYLDLYKKFTYSQQESYRLDHIGYVELGEQKLDYSEYGTLQTLYVENHQKFIEYNVKDVELVVNIDAKMKLIDMALALAYDAKVNYSDVYTQVRMWDVLIHNHLWKYGIAVSPKQHIAKDNQYVGAYVKDPQVGKHDWVMSFDLNSLYPHLIMQYNISPETLIDDIPYDVDIDALVDGKAPNVDSDVVMTANGHCFRRDVQGFLPQMMQKMYDERVIAKKAMLEAETKLQDETDPQRKRQLVNEISKYKNLQLAKKVQLNSAYGALGNEWFRFFDIRQATAITMGGQLSIRWIERKMNEYLNKVLETEGEDYVVASDTDSLYIVFDRLVRKVLDEGEFASESDYKRKCVDFLDRVARAKIEPYIDKCYQELATQMNAYAQKMQMKREAIADRGIWTAKKRYILNVWDNEGVRYKEPKLKMMGIEAVKSSTPGICRSAIRDALRIVMAGSESELQDFVADFREQFTKTPFEDVAFPRGVSAINKYRDTATLYRKSTPIHVRGSLVYNNEIKQRKLTQKYEEINEGEKIKFCYLKVPNPVREDVISIPNVLPPEFGIEPYIDYDKQFDKAFLEPMRIILETIGWKSERTANLEDFFV
jgi:DNA polymerase elongation subunit (family B)